MTAGKNLPIEQIMLTLIGATQDVFKMFMGIEVFAGKVERKVQTIDADVISVVGLGGARVNYMIISADKNSAVEITKSMLMEESADDASIRDVFGELSNNIAGVFKSKYANHYGNVAMGLPLVVSGKIEPIGTAESSSTMNVPQQGLIIPFACIERGIKFTIIFYM